MGAHCGRAEKADTEEEERERERPFFRRGCMAGCYSDFRYRRRETRRRETIRIMYERGRGRGVSSRRCQLQPPSHASNIFLVLRLRPGTNSIYLEERGEISSLAANTSGQKNFKFFNIATLVCLWRNLLFTLPTNQGIQILYNRASGRVVQIFCHDGFSSSIVTLATPLSSVANDKIF